MPNDISWYSINSYISFWWGCDTGKRSISLVQAGNLIDLEDKRVEDISNGDVENVKEVWPSERILISGRLSWRNGAKRKNAPETQGLMHYRVEEGFSH